MADYKKSLTFQAKLDTSDIGPTIDNLKRQFEEMSRSINVAKTQGTTAARLSQQGYGGLLSVPKVEDIQKSKRELAGFIREQAQQQERLYKLIESQKDKLEKLQSIKKDSLKDSKEELALEEKKLATRQELLRLEEQYGAKNQTINKAMDMSSGRGGGGGGGRGPGEAIVAGLTAAATLKGAQMAVRLITGAAGEYEIYKGIPLQRTVNTGSAIQNAIGEQLKGLAGGDIVNQSAFMKERQGAFGEAREAMQGRIATDELLAPLTFGVGGGARANLMKSKIFHALGMKDQAERYESSYTSERMNELFENYQAGAQGKMEANPLKTLASNRLQQRYMQDLQTERMLGLSFQGFAGAGGFQERANRAGFNDDLARNMAVQMQGGGGSTRGMRDLSVLGLQAQRGFDLTNAGSVLGKISGGAGDARASEQVFRKIMEESIRVGLDTSDFREEQRRFADATSELLSQSGVQTAADAERVLQGFSKFIGNAPTIRGMEGAKSAYEEAQGFSAEAGGRGGALQFAAMMQQGLGGLGAMAMGGLAEMPDKDLVASNPFIIAEAAKAGISPEALIEQVKQAKRSKQYVELGLNQNKVQGLGQYLQRRGLAGRDLTTEDLERMKNGSDEDRENFAEYMKVVEAPAIRSRYESIQKRQAVVRGLLGTEGGGGMGDLYEQRLQGATGRPEDDVIAATGVAAQVFLENFRQFKDEITPTNAALTDLAKNLMLVAAAANLVPTRDQSKVLNWLRDSLPQSTKNQDQGGKPSK